MPRPATRPTGNRTTRQYALSTWLGYLTAGGVPVSVLVDRFNAGTPLLPQAYLDSRVPWLGAIFADYAAACTPDMTFLTRAQWTRALQEIATYGDPADPHEFVMELTDAGTGGAYVDPPTGLLPRGWGWNVVHVTSTQAANWRFEVDGMPAGSAGAPALFQARLRVRTATSDTVYTVPLAGGQDGFISVVTTAAAAAELYLVVVAVPLQFSGNQTYAWRLKIDRN